jgi:hypothetical protein
LKSSAPWRSAAQGRFHVRTRQPEPPRALADDCRQVRERGRGDHPAHPGIHRGGPEGVSEKDGAGGRKGIEDAADVAPLVVPVRSGSARRVPVGPGIEGERRRSPRARDARPHRGRTAGCRRCRAGRRRGPALPRRPEEPALEPRTLAREPDGLVGPARMTRERPPDRVEDGRCAPFDRGEPGANEDGGAGCEQAKRDERRDRQPPAGRASEPHASLYAGLAASSSGGARRSPREAELSRVSPPRRHEGREAILAKRP